MTIDSDAFSIQLLDEAKGFLEKADQLDREGEEKLRDAFLHASLVVGFSALESHINGVAAELSDRNGWSLLDRSLLLERSVRFTKGQWGLGDLQFFRTEDRLEFLFVSHGNSDFRTTSWWSDLRNGMNKRNGLVHPRDTVEFTVVDAKRYLSAIIETLDNLYLAVFKRGHPVAGRGLQSTLYF